MLAQIDHPDFAADVVSGKVNHDVIALGDSLHIQFRELDRMREEVSVVANLNDVRAIAQAEFEETRHTRVEYAEAILARLHFKIRPVGKIHAHHVTNKSVELEDVHGQLAVLVESLIGQHEIHVKVEISPCFCVAGWQTQIHAVIHGFIAAIKAAIDVEHGGIA